jgi:tetratricopeptide (TPR) repeat protein
MQYSLFTRILTLSICIFFCACAQTSVQQNASNTTVFPKLLDRVEGLRNGKEWDDVQNFYGNNCDAIRKNPADYAAKINLAECFMQEARVTGEHPHYYPAALQMLNEVSTDLAALKSPNVHQTDLLFRALSNKASVQLSLHAFGAALETATAAVQMNQNNASIYGCLVDANVELGNYAEAVRLCDAMVSIRPDLRSYARVSYIRQMYGDLDGAIDAMQMAVQSGLQGTEQTEWARLTLGELYEQKGDLKMAELQYLTSLQYRENYPFALAALSNIEMQQGKKADAWKHLDMACALIPEIGFYMQKADFMMQEGKSAEAKLVLQEVETMFEEDIAAGHQMGLELGRFHAKYTGKLEQAMHCLQAEHQARPKNADVNRDLAELYTKMGDKAKAEMHRAASIVKS